MQFIALLLSSAPLPLLAAAALMAAALLLCAAARSMRDLRSRRGRYHPLVGTFLHQLINFRRLYDYQAELSRRHKSFRVLISPFQTVVYTNDPVVVEHILRSNFHNYGKGMRNYENLRELLGDGIFAVDGSKWRHQRKLASYEFSTRSLREHSGAIFRKNATRLAQAVREAAISHQAMEIQEWFTKSAMDSIVEVAFGIELNCLQGSTEENKRFVKAIDSANMLTNLRYINPLWKLLRFLNIGSEGVLLSNMRVVDDYIYKLIHSKIAEMFDKQNESSKDDILSRFLRESEKDPKNMDHRFLRDIVLNFVVAGKDSTAGTLAWFFYMICKHPTVQEKIAREVKEVMRADDNASFEEFAANITDELLDNMQYLLAALNETLRLYPAAPMDPKVCFSDDTLPDGFDIRKGETIIYQPYAMGRMKYIWGEDAEIFRPERWLDANGIVCPESPFKFTAFQAGPRVCLGKEFAYRQMKIFTIVLLRFFSFKLRDEKEIAHYRVSLLLQIDKGLHLYAFPR